MIIGTLYGMSHNHTNANAPLQIAFTQTYKAFKSTDPTEQFRETLPSFAKYLSRLCSYFEVYPECTDDGNLHYHAYLVIKDEFKWFKYGQRYLRRRGFIKCKGIRNLKGWRKYCSKKSLKYSIKLFELAGLYPITRENYHKVVKNTQNDLETKVRDKKPLTILDYLK